MSRPLKSVEVHGATPQKVRLTQLDLNLFFLAPLKILAALEITPRYRFQRDFLIITTSTTAAATEMQPSSLLRVRWLFPQTHA